MSKQTTAQVAQALKISKQRIYAILYHHPALRPSERKGKSYLWSSEELATLRAHLMTYSYKPHHKSSAKIR